MNVAGFRFLHAGAEVQLTACNFCLWLLGERVRTPPLQVRLDCPSLTVSKFDGARAEDDANILGSV